MPRFAVSSGFSLSLEDLDAVVEIIVRDHPFFDVKVLEGPADVLVVTRERPNVFSVIGPGFNSALGNLQVNTGSVTGSRAGTINTGIIIEGKRIPPITKPTFRIQIIVPKGTKVNALNVRELNFTV